MNKEKFDFQGITEWHDKGILGEGQKIAIIDSPFVIPQEWKDSVFYAISEVDKNEEEKHWEHGAMTCSVLKQIVPGAQIFIFDMFESWPWDVMGWCVENGVRIISASIGYQNVSSSFIEQLKSASEAFLEHHDGLLFASAGNSDYSGVGPPARKSSWVAVGAAELENGQPVRKFYSAVGSELEVMGFTNLEIDISAVGPSTRTIYTGTSCACPNIAGMIALWSSNRERPKTKDEIRNLLSDNTVGVALHDTDYIGYGLFVLPDPISNGNGDDEEENDEENGNGDEEEEVGLLERVIRILVRIISEIIARFRA